MVDVIKDISPLPYQPGDIVPFRLNAGIVVASFFVSLIGTITTVELLQRRTNAKGWTAWWELFSCSLSMGLVAIWCMHYVGNRGIILGDGDARIQLVYSSGYTAVSSIIPIVALFIAFAIADRRHRGKKFLMFALVLSGICAGLAIVGMHYTANLGVSNYHIYFDQRYVGGAIIIACAACVLALTLIFMLQDLWINFFYMRLVCALVIAGAVTGMHYEGTVGTSYRLKYSLNGSGTNGLRNTNVITAVVISLLTLPICLLIAIQASRRQKQLADRAQQVVLACARFDPEGRLMVTHEGLLPCQNMTMHENQKSFEDQFNITHPAFQWIYRASHNWGSIVRWLPNMRRHLQSVHFLNHPMGTKSASVDSSLFEVNSEVEDYSIIFRESFCCAAASLAAMLKTSVPDVGSLYAEVMMTGTLSKNALTGRKTLLNRFNFGRSKLVRDAEAQIGVDMFGKGQLLLLVHQCDKAETAQFLAEGYRFAPIEVISEHLARSMRVPLNYLQDHLNALQKDAKHDIDVPRGTMLGCFSLRAGVSRRTWEVLVKKDMPYRLPWVQLSPKTLDTSSQKLYTSMDGLSVAGCLTRVNQRLDSPDELNIVFWEDFKSKIQALGDAVPESFFRQAVFSAKVLKITTLVPGSNQVASCDLLAFHIIPDIHASTLKSGPEADIEYTPLSFLRCRQQVLEGVAQKAAFERKVHHEFATIFASKDTGNGPLARPTPSRRQTNQNRTNKFFSRAIPLKKLNHKSSSSEDSSLRSGSPENISMSAAESDYGGGAISKTSMTLSSTSAGGLPESIIPSRYVPQIAMAGFSAPSSGAGSISPMPMGGAMPFGGIMVSNDITVETTTQQQHTGGKGVVSESTVEFGVESGPTATTQAYAGQAEGEGLTYVDELYQMAVQKWQQR